MIDLRTLSPLDLDPVVDSVRRTGRLVVVAEAPSETSVGSEVARRLVGRGTDLADRHLAIRVNGDMALFQAVRH